MIGYLDCATGISGDKFLGALIDAGFSAGALRKALEPLGLADAFQVRRVRSAGISATGIEVAQATDARWRHWRDIRAMLEDATPLAYAVRVSAIRAFTLLAEAEARVHDVDVEQVHFHEVGAADTIVDIVGVAAGMDALGIEQLFASPVAVGAAPSSARTARCRSRLPPQQRCSMASRSATAASPASSPRPPALRCCAHSSPVTARFRR